MFANKSSDVVATRSVRDHTRCTSVPDAQTDRQTDGRTSWQWRDDSYERITHSALITRNDAIAMTQNAMYVDKYK